MSLPHVLLRSAEQLDETRERLARVLAESLTGEVVDYAAVYSALQRAHHDLSESVRAHVAIVRAIDEGRLAMAPTLPPPRAL